MSATWLCAYAITRNRPMELGSARLVGHRELGVVVADVDPARFDGVDTLEPQDSTLAELVREHDAVVRTVFGHEPVLPLRFGSILDGEDAAVRLLRTGYERARACLADLDGHREWGVRVRHAAPVPATASPRPDSAGLTGTEYLAQRRQKLKADQRSRSDVAVTAERLRDDLRQHAADRAERTRAPGVLVDVAYLVPATGEAAFHSEIRRFAEEFRAHGATVETTGPWPPYSFTGFELEVTADG